MKPTYAKRARMPCIRPMLMAGMMVAIAAGVTFTHRVWAKHAKGEYAWITVHLASGSNSKQMEAIKLINQLMDQPGHYALPFRIAYNWLPMLLKTGHDATVAHLARESILANPGYTILVGLCQQDRVEALLAMGKVNKALRNAKSLFDVCLLGQTRTALLLLEEGLEKAYPDGGKLIRLFIREQMAGARKKGVQCKVLSLIKINAKPYEQALENVHGTSQWALQEKENLLLLAGHVRRALRTAKLAAALNTNIRGYLGDAADVARAMKAVDGTVYRANAHMLAAARRAARLQ